MVMRSAADDATGVFVERRADIHAHGAQRRRQSEQQPGEDGDASREGEDAQVGMNVERHGIRSARKPCAIGGCCPKPRTERQPRRHRARAATLSVSIAGSGGARPAPIARRIPISRWRHVARASSRLATLAQAISKTMPTTAMSTSSGSLKSSRMRRCASAPRPDLDLLVGNLA